MLNQVGEFESQESLPISSSFRPLNLHDCTHCEIILWQYFHEIQCFKRHIGELLSDFALYLLVRNAF